MIDILAVYDKIYIFRTLLFIAARFYIRVQCWGYELCSLISNALHIGEIRVIKFKKNEVTCQFLRKKITKSKFFVRTLKLQYGHTQNRSIHSMQQLKKFFKNQMVFFFSIV